MTPNAFRLLIELGAARARERFRELRALLAPRPKLYVASCIQCLRPLEEREVGFDGCCPDCSSL